MNDIRARIVTQAAITSFVLLSAAGLGACKSKDQYAAMDTTAMSNDTTAKRIDSAAGAMDTSAAAHSGWSSPTILGFATVANSGEVALGRLGEQKATNPAVKAFARQMVKDHSRMLMDTKSLASKLSAPADTTANDARDLANHGNDEITELTAKAAGADWDKNYMDKMVDDHQKVLDKLQDAAKNTTDAHVRSALEKATGMVQQHLTKAQDIKAKLTS